MFVCCESTKVFDELKSANQQGKIKQVSINKGNLTFEDSGLSSDKQIQENQTKLSSAEV